MRTVFAILVLLATPTALAEEPAPEITEAFCAAFMHRYHESDRWPTRAEIRLWDVCTDRYDSSLDIAESLIDRRLLDKLKRESKSSD